MEDCFRFIFDSLALTGGLSKGQREFSFSKLEDNLSVRVRLDRKLSEGGFGIVYLGTAVAPSLGDEEESIGGDLNTFAVKVCHYADEPGLSKIYVEIENYKRFRCKSDHLVSLLGVHHDREHRTFFLVFPFYKYSLADPNFLKSVPESRIIDIFWGICKGVSYLHEYAENANTALLDKKEPIPFAHRDLKPENILLRQDPERPDKFIPVIIDFGSMRLARTYVENSQSAIALQDEAAENSFMLYRAPELHEVRTYSHLDEKTDIWSLGCILYFMTFGENPFAGVQGRGDSILLATNNEAYSIPSGATQTIVIDLIKSMLKRDPKERPTVQSILNTLTT